MTTVGIRQLKSRLSAVLRRVRAGERVVVTDRGRPIAALVPVAMSAADRRIEALLREGAVQWAGLKPRGLPRRPRVRGAPVGRAVLEGRR